MKVGTRVATLYVLPKNKTTNKDCFKMSFLQPLEIAIYCIGLFSQCIYLNIIQP